jgi:hypothetical protein
MRKLQSVTADPRPRTRRSKATFFLVFSLLLMFSPIVYESGLRCYASWQGLFGTYPQIQTPVLDALNAGYETASFDLKQLTSGIFRQSPWKPSFVIPFAIFWTGVLAMLLRKG